MLHKIQALHSDYMHAREMVRACCDPELAQIWRKIRNQRYQRFMRARKKAK